MNGLSGKCFLLSLGDTLLIVLRHLGIDHDVVDDTGHALLLVLFAETAVSESQVQTVHVGGSHLIGELATAIVELEYGHTTITDEQLALFERGHERGEVDFAIDGSVRSRLQLLVLTLVVYLDSESHQ